MRRRDTDLIFCSGLQNIFELRTKDEKVEFLLLKMSPFETFRPGQAPRLTPDDLFSVEGAEIW